MRKILLNKKNSKTSSNHNNIIPVELNRDMALFHDELMTDTVDTLQVYNDEKDKCTKHRFIFTLYPMCSNSLFNKITEVVRYEGSSSAQTVTNSTSFTGVTGAVSTQSINRIQAVRNTEYSNEKFGITYHCGADIFNNHLLRKKENISVQKRKSAKGATVYNDNGSEASSQYALKTDAFNTIGDYCRNSNGELLTTYLPSSSSNYTYSTKYTAYIPLYSHDTISSFIEAYSDGIKRKDGWMGFYNPTTLHIPVSGTTTNGYYVNKCMNDKEGCEFISMAPEKDLFYFTPKFNPYRNRLEYNWDYCLTYPAESIYNDGVVLTGKGQGLPINKVSELYGANGLPAKLFRTSVDHNLDVGDYVNIKFDNTQVVKCRVNRIGDSEGKNENYFFSVRKDDIDDIVDSNANPIRFAKVIGGFECEYYFRKFKKFDKHIKSTLNRLAFADTIYGDEVTQLVYTDDVDISQYKDNRGRPLTEIYLTLLKSNRGHDKWYANKCEPYLESVEYSHVFGKVTSGLDVPSFVGRDFPTLRFQHNINPDNYKSKVEIAKSSLFLENNITNKDDSFYGDLVEFNPITVTETVLEVVKHRFNTAQREFYDSNNTMYGTIYHDEIYGDNYDYDRYGTNKVSGATRFYTQKLNDGYANIAPEGYTYVPHHKVKIAEYDTLVRQLSDTNITDANALIITNTLTSKKITFNTPNRYSLLPNDILALVNKGDGEVYQYRVISYVYNNNVYECEAEIMGSKYPSDTNVNNYWLFIHNLEIPEYAYMLPDGTGRHIWREVLPPSSLSFMSDLYNVTFTNGALYHHSNITFPVRRQDPFHQFEMFVKKDGVQISNNFEVPTTEMDLTGEEYFVEKSNVPCF